MQWIVAKVTSSEHAGAWMTTSAPPPIPVGQTI
jgi:hypothetical protein